MNEINVGIVGVGWVAGAHIEAFKHIPGAKVTAVCSRRELDEAALAQQYGTPLKAYRDYDEMLKDPSIHVIDICTPHPFHAEQAIAAARAGKHLIIEKPIAIAWPDAVAIKEAIDAAGVKSCVCFEVRFSQQAEVLRATLDQGLLGTLHYAEVDYYHGIGPWYGQYSWNIKKDMGGSSLLTAGCHALDLMLFLMDSEVEEVTSYSNRSKSPIFAPYEYDTTSVTLLKFKDGKLGKVASVTDCLQPYYFHIHLCGSEGTLLDNRLYSSKLKITKQRWSTLETPLIDSGDVADHPYLPQFQAFVDSLRKNENMPRTDFATAFESHRVVFAADLSAAEGRTVKLSELT
ncbi:MAG: Gfo/Idh/MocA family oxidoreductase [Blastocatellia bacterium]|nr:Gfo/Idh/MocA family oxidoreductase [Blastocatellia bacterium]